MQRDEKFSSGFCTRSDVDYLTSLTEPCWVLATRCERARRAQETNRTPMTTTQKTGSASNFANAPDVPVSRCAIRALRAAHP